MLTMQWCLLICLTRDSCLRSSYLTELYRYFQCHPTLTLFCNPVHGCLCSDGCTEKEFHSLFMDSRGKKGCSLFSRTQSTPPLNRIFIYLPSWCHFGLQNPWRRKCIKPLTVFTCVGLMLMCEGRLEDGGWEIDHRWMSVRGILIPTTAFHALSSKNPSGRNPAPSENTTTYHID